MSVAPHKPKHGEGETGRGGEWGGGEDRGRSISTLSFKICQPKMLWIVTWSIDGETLKAKAEFCAESTRPLTIAYSVSSCLSGRGG